MCTSSACVNKAFLYINVADNFFLKKGMFSICYNLILKEKPTKIFDALEKFLS